MIVATWQQLEERVLRDKEQNDLSVYERRPNTSQEVDKRNEERDSNSKKKHRKYR